MANKMAKSPELLRFNKMKDKVLLKMELSTRIALNMELIY
jgi:hypothetical protein